PSIFWTALVLAAAGMAAGRRVHAVALPAILAAAYLMPAVYLRWLGYENFGLEIIWILPLLGLIASGRDAWHWSLPRAWQWPLVPWSLMISVTWPIVFLREVDFAPSILPLPRVSNTSIGISPWDAGLNITYFALGHNVGILWIDALFRWFKNAPAHALTR